MFCDQCGSYVSAGMKACAKCGAPIRDEPGAPIEDESADTTAPIQRAVCSNCGEPLVAGDAFCTYCGTPVDAATRPGPSDQTMPMSQASGVSMTGASLQASGTNTPGANEGSPSGKRETPKVIVALIMILIVVLLAVGGLIGWKIYQDNQNASDSASATLEETSTSSSTTNSSNDSASATGNSVGSTTNSNGTTGNSSTTTNTNATNSNTGSTTSSNPYINVNPGDYVFSDSSSRYLSESDLASLSEEKLRIARNEIFARNGRIFTDAELEEYFTSKSWYHPSIPAEDFDANIESRLNSYEYANALLIKQVEEDKGYL